jgi:hypothetical protein
MQSPQQQPEHSAGPASSAGAAVLVSGLLAFNLGVVGPRAVHAANLDEYSVSFWSVLGQLGVLTGLLAASLALLLLLIPRRRRGRAVVFVFSLAALAWLQGNWLLGSYGLLDGDGLDMQAAAADRLRDAALWLGGIAAAQLLYGRLGRHVTKLAAVFLLLQALALPFAESFGGATRGDASESLSLVPDDELFVLSRERNVVLVILDTVTSDTFVQLADGDPAEFDRRFAGFVVYTDAIGAFPSTQYSLPALLGAPAFDNRTPSDDYMARALQRDSLTVPLLEAGWRVDWVSAWPLFCRQGRYSTCYAIPRPYAAPEEYRTQVAAELADLSLFRHAPAGLKPRIYAGGDWLLQSALSGESGPPLFVASAAAFFDDFNARLRVGRDQPTLKIVHTGGGHGPFVLDPDCAQVPARPYDARHYRSQVSCALAQTGALLDRLRELGAFDAATIVVAGDHGASFDAQALGTHGLTPQRLARARPLLAVKWPGTRGGLRRSEAPASIQDIAPTIAAAARLDADFPGRDLAGLDADAPRTRHYAIYIQRQGTPGGYRERVERYAVSAGSRRPTAWQLDTAAVSPAVSLLAERIDAGAPESTRHFSYLGWGPPQRDAAGVAQRSARGPIASVFAELPRGGDVELRARLRVPAPLLPQSVAVQVDGIPIGSWLIEDAGFREHVLRIPARLVGAEASALTFLPANHQLRGARGPVSAFDLEWLAFGRAPEE